MYRYGSDMQGPIQNPKFYKYFSYTNMILPNKQGGIEIFPNSQTNPQMALDNFAAILA